MLQRQRECGAPVERVRIVMTTTVISVIYVLVDLINNKSN